MAKTYELAFKLGAELTNNFKSTFKQAGKAITGVGAAVTSVAGAVGAGALLHNFDQMADSMNKLQAATGETGKDFEELKSLSRDIFANNYGENFGQINDALISAKNITGETGKDLQKLTEHAFLLSDTFDYEVNESVKASDVLMKNFGLSGEQAMAYIAEGSQKGLNYADDFMDTIREYSVHFDAAGLSAQDFMGMMQNAKNAGVFNLDYAADAFKEFGIIMREDSDRASNALSQLGLNSTKLRSQFAQGGEGAKQAFQTIAKELSKVKDPLDQNAIGVELFGSKFEDMGAKAVLEMAKTNDAIKGSTDTLNQMNEVRYDSMGNAFKGMGRTLLVELAYPISDYLLPAVNNFANHLKDVLPIAVDYLKNVMQTIGPVIQQLWGNFQAILPALGQAFSSLIPLLQSYAMVWQEQVGNLASNILPLLANAVATIFPFILQVVQQAVPFAEVLLSSLIPVISSLASTVLPMLLQYAQAVFPVFLSVIQAVLPIVVNLIRSIIPVIIQIASTVLPILLQVVQTIFPILLQIIQSVIPIVISILSGVASIITGVVLPAIRGILAIVRFVFPLVLTLVQNSLTLIGGVLKTFTKVLQGDWSGAWKAIKSTAVEIMNNIIGFFKGIDLLSIGKNMIGGLVKGIGSMKDAVLNAVLSVVPGFLRNKVKNFIGGGSSKGQVPQYATGGIVSNAQLAMIGEGGDTEAVIPWNNTKRALDLWTLTGQKIGALGGTDQGPSESPFDVKPASYSSNDNSSNFVYHAGPTNVYIQGDADKDEVARGIEEGERSAREEWEEMIKDHERTKF
ncbi:MULTISPECIES: phage tail tape measure protein [Pontibacillus]|uniref:Phage tail tape measure protein n=1 Tax=Pontibacillus chungwhensis TaxID=265426 RepID=A0ABY8UZQ7_9BACI|nr:MULTISPECIES: phage tail tape measure protein [Pontibacillus]MCD5324779.1 phage tail tape measure protein [Pontibacillus sp. HN14]WIF98738.1 phage tail tape measure protein [Pontibacillus chungwhensis]